jgi:hypothetical protein
MDLTKKIYTFKLDIGHPYNYAMCLDSELYQLYQQDLKFYIMGRYHKFKTFAKLGELRSSIDYVDCNNVEMSVSSENKFYTLYDVNNNEPKLLNLCIHPNAGRYKRKYFIEICSTSNKYKIVDIDESYGKDNIYIKEIYDITNTTPDNFDFYFRTKIIHNNRLIQIMIDNFCKLHYIEDIKITMRLNDPDYTSTYILDTITFVLDDTEKSNNRKIKFYEHFSDFYRNKNNDKKYKIIQEPNGDGYCLIEELEELEELESTQNLSENRNLTKSSQEIIIDKDLEIEKLKKEILELKKFYINS